MEDRETDEILGRFRRPARILLIDDHPVFREGLRRIIEQKEKLTVCGEADTAKEALQEIEAKRPDLVITDISLRRESGLELIKNVAAVHPSAAMLALSMHDETLYAKRALKAGARGYIMKDEPAPLLLGAIARILNGDIYLSEALTRQLDADGQIKPGNQDDPLDVLSDRELEVFTLIGKGRKTGDIAASLNVSVKTVESHRDRIRRKLSLENGNQLIRAATTWVEAD